MEIKLMNEDINLANYKHISDLELQKDIVDTTQELVALRLAVDAMTELDRLNLYSEAKIMIYIFESYILAEKSYLTNKIKEYRKNA